MAAGILNEVGMPQFHLIQTGADQGQHDFFRWLHLAVVAVLRSALAGVGLARRPAAADKPNSWGFDTRIRKAAKPGDEFLPVRDGGWMKVHPDSAEGISEGGSLRNWRTRNQQQNLG